MAGSSFDKSLDKEIAKKVLNFDKTQVIVSIMCYNEGSHKIQLSRLVQDGESGDWKFAKLGRLTKDEAIATAGAMADLVAKMK